MTMKLIGAGLPRTGTMSLQHALSQLLDAPCYHMLEAFSHPEHAPVWVEAFKGRPPVWDDFLAGYAAGVDTPFSSLWRELAEAYPDAPVLLSRRESAQVWYRSMDKTVLVRTREHAAGEGPAEMDPAFSEMFTLMGRGFLDHPDDPESIVAGYEQRLADVRAAIPHERLVEWQPGDGWEPLCRALGVPVPDEEFPHENSTAAFVARMEDAEPGGNHP